MHRPFALDEVDQDAADQRALGLGEAGSRLVEQQHARLQRQHHRQLQRLLHAVGQDVARDRQLPVEAGRGDDVAALAGQRERPAHGSACDVPLEPVAGDAQAFGHRQGFEEAGGLELATDAEADARSAGACARCPVRYIATVPPVRS